MKSITGLFIMPWWLKFCVFGRQNEQHRKQYDRATFIFQLAELLEKTEVEVQNSSELEKEGEIVSTGKFCLTYVTSYVHKCPCGSACFFLSLLLALSLSLSIS